MLDQRVQDQMIHLNEKYECLTTEYDELHRVVMVMRSHMSGPCVCPYWSHGPSDDQPPPPPPLSALPLF
jgi:hypothetical protein